MEDEKTLVTFMNEAIEEAKHGLREDGIPIGSVLVTIRSRMQKLSAFETLAD